MARGTPATRLDAYAAIDSERGYQEMRKNRDSGEPNHSIEEFLVYMQDYTQEALHVASRTWGPGAVPATLEIVRKVGGLAVACMEAHGAPQREGFEHTPDIARLAATILHAGIGEPSQNESAIDTAIRLIKGMGANARAKVNHD